MSKIPFLVFPKKVLLALTRLVVGLLTSGRRLEAWHGVENAWTSPHHPSTRCCVRIAKSSFLLQGSSQVAKNGFAGFSTVSERMDLGMIPWPFKARKYTPDIPEHLKRASLMRTAFGVRATFSAECSYRVAGSERGYPVEDYILKQLHHP